MLIIAHRGANQEALENSAPAFETAISSGSHRIELDVRMTKDHKLIVYHDDKISNGIKHIPIEKLTLVELQEIYIHQHGISLLEMEECLERFLFRIELNIEIKPNNEQLNQKLVRLLKNHPLKGKIIISSFLEGPLLFFRDHAPDIKRACLIDNSTLFQWPSTFSNYAPQVFMDKIKTNIIHPYYKIVDENFMEFSKHKNWIVYPWVGMKDEPSHERETIWNELFGLEVDGLCTNCPREFKSWLSEQHKINPNQLYEKITKIYSQTLNETQ